MKYKNAKTGATINSPFTINGGDWVVVTDMEDEVAEEVEETTEQYVEEEIDLEAMTNKELEEFAKKHKIELSYNDKRNKESLINAIAKAFE